MTIDERTAIAPPLRLVERFRVRVGACEVVLSESHKGTSLCARLEVVGPFKSALLRRGAIHELIAKLEALDATLEQHERERGDNHHRIPPLRTYQPTKPVQSR